MRSYLNSCLFFFFMGLEAIVNSILAPIEKLAAKVASYMPGSVEKAFKAFGKDYSSVKEFLMHYTLRIVDTSAKYVYDTSVKYVFQPLATLYKEHPYLTTIAGAFAFIYFCP